jgi:hypothetical protein
MAISGGFAAHGEADCRTQSGRPRDPPTRESAATTFPDAPTKLHAMRGGGVRSLILRSKWRPLAVLGWRI